LINDVEGEAIECIPKVCNGNESEIRVEGERVKREKGADKRAFKVLLAAARGKPCRANESLSHPKFSLRKDYSQPRLGTQTRRGDC
jgi:hypothetical protein